MHTCVRDYAAGRVYRIRGSTRLPNMIVTVASFNGGVGRTVTAVHLAAFLSGKAWLYATGLGLSFFVSWYLLPALFFSS